MNHFVSVLKIQYKMFIRDKGMFFFYLAGVIVSGIIVPFFSHSLVTSLTAAAFITTMWLKPILSESLAGEREKRTLESLLSTSVKGKSILWGKLVFNLLFAVILFGLSVVLTALTYSAAGYESEFTGWQRLCVAGMAILNFTAISISGTCLSADSADMRTANGRVSAAAYPLGLLLLIYISVVSLNEPAAAFITGGIAGLIYVCVTVVFGVKASVMKQHKYYENIKTKNTKKTQHGGQISYTSPKSQFEAVFRHELRYILTLKQQIIFLTLFCFAPMILCVGLKVLEMTGKLTGINYFDFTVVLTFFIVPSAARTLISFSIGGEKAYKTGESLLSAPLNIKSVFLAKSAAPVLISAGMIVLSVLLALLGVNIYGFSTGAKTIEMYSAAQFLLLIPAGITACITMIFITGVLSVIMKTPRKGLYLSTLVSVILTVPAALIIYPVKEQLFWSVIFLTVLLLVNIVFWFCISGNIRRSRLMNRI